MGLDMYAYTAPKSEVDEDVDFDIDDLGDVSQLHYWRKHPNLHGWMQNLYHEKGGEGELNCATVRLTLDDLAELERTINADALPATSGFFFGRSDGTEKEGDLAFVQKARDAIKAGKAVFYDCWW